ncbi:Tom20 [Kluyveromyces lactis]|nr:Tom20 [Kluyveromyces lactis]
MSSNQANLGRILTIAGVTVATAVAGYAAYFDYQRRNNPEFRKQLKRKLKQHAELEKQAKEEAKQEKLKRVNEILIAELTKDPLPQDPSQREATFSSNVELGEKLAAVPGSELESALKFYKALSVYPNPSDLLGIYQRSLTEEIYENIVLMIALMPPSNVSSFLTGAGVGAGASAAPSATVEIDE